MKCIFVTITTEVLAYVAFLVPAIMETIKNYRNPYPRFNEQREKRISSIIEDCKKKGISIKTRSIETGR